MPYFIHHHNRTWTNERSVELRLAQQFVNGVAGRGMEFGNVLTRYGLARSWAIVDKYEVAPNVLNVDVVDYTCEPLDFVVSVSTLEHVGWDEDVRDPEKVIVAFNRLRSLLKPDGRLFITGAIGYSDYMDAAVVERRLPVDRQVTFVRDARGTLGAQLHTGRARHSAATGQR